jgi:hypothetical protein
MTLGGRYGGLLTHSSYTTPWGTTLPSNIFVQFLAGPAEIRDGLMGLMLWLIALISLVIGPICLLLFFALQFLPYHETAITWCSSSKWTG